MNIQQALNQSLLAVGTSVYLTGQTIDRGRETTGARYQALSDRSRENDREYDEKVQPKIDEWKAKGDTQEQIDASLDANPIVQEGRQIQANLERTEKELRKWYWTREVPDSITNLHYSRSAVDSLERYEAAEEKKRKDADKSMKPIVSLRKKTKNYAQQEGAMQERPHILKMGLNKSMHQPSISKEE